MPFIKRVSTGLALIFSLSACVTTPEIVTPAEAAQKAPFDRDRATCRAVAERTTPYVDPRDGNAVTTRQVTVEGETQKCMLSRGWNDPEHNGWSAGRS